MGREKCCGQASATNHFYSPILVSIIPSVSILSLCTCSSCHTIVETVDHQFYTFGDSTYQSPLSRDEEMDTFPVRIDNDFPINHSLSKLHKGNNKLCTNNLLNENFAQNSKEISKVQIKKLISTHNCFYLLTKDNDLYFLGYDDNDQIETNESPKKWILCKNNILNICAGEYIYFLFVCDPFLNYQSNMKWTDVVVHLK